MRWLTLAWLLIPLAGCPSGGDADSSRTTAGDASADAAPVAGRVLVWADPVLSDVLGGLEDEFTARHAPGFTALYLERGELTARLEQDPPPPLPDVFIVADQQVFTALREGGFIDEATARTFAGDRLALVQAAGGGYRTGSLFDSYKLRFEEFAIGRDTTATGFYAEQALLTEGCFDRLQDRMVRYDRTADLLAALAAGGRRIGIVFASTAVQNPEVEVVMLIGQDRHQDIRYRAMAAPQRAGAPGVAALLRFLAEEQEIQTLLGGYGLLDRDTALIEDR